MPDAELEIEIGDQVEPEVREALTMASGPSDCNVATPAVTPYEDAFQGVVDIVKYTAAVPDDAMVQRIVADVQDEYVKVWYTTDEMEYEKDFQGADN